MVHVGNILGDTYSTVSRIKLASINNHLIKYHLCTMFKINNNWTAYLECLIYLKQRNYSLSRNNLDFELVKPKTKLVEKIQLSYSMVRLWNVLPKAVLVWHYIDSRGK